MNTYDPALVTLMFGGQAIVGYAEGTFINAARSEDAFSFRAGSDGQVVRSRNRNRTGSVTITLLPSSPSNDILSGIALADEQAGLGVYPLFIKDLSGTTLVTAPSAWVRKLAELAFAKEASEDREWVLDCDELVVHVGGLVT
jgi:hypothetical protein